MRKFKKEITVLLIFFAIMTLLSIKYIVNASDGVQLIVGNNTNTDNLANNDTNNTNTTNDTNNTSIYNNTVTNTNKNTTNLPQTGIDDTIVYIIIIFAISALFAYKKMKDYRLK